MSFAPKPGFPAEPTRRPEDKPASNLYTGVFGSPKFASESTSPFASPKNVDALAGKVQELLAAKDFNFGKTVNFIASSLLDFYNASGVAIAIEQDSGIVCCATAGDTAPDIGTGLNIASGISGICFRGGESQYCHDARRDERVDVESCRALGILSILISPVVVSDRTAGLVEVFSAEDFFFDKNDISTLERIAALVAKAQERRLSLNSKPRAAISHGVEKLAYNREIAPQTLAPAITTPATSSGVAAAAVAAAKSPETFATFTSPTVMGTAAAEISVTKVQSGVPPRVAVPEQSSAVNSAMRELLASATPAAPKLSNRASSRATSQRRNKYLLLATAGIAVVVAAWGVTRAFQHERNSTLAVVASPVVSDSNVRPIPAQIPAPAAAQLVSKVAEKKMPVIPNSKTPAKPATNSVQVQAQVVDLLSAKAKTDPPQRTNRVAEEAPQAPSLGTLAVNKPAFNLASSLATTTAVNAPRVAHNVVIVPEVLIHKVAPIYPPIAKSAHVGGEVTVRLTIAKDGSVQNLVIEKGHPLLREAVLDAVKQWKYKPYMADGEPREIQALVTVKFNQ